MNKQLSWIVVLLAYLAPTYVFAQDEIDTSTFKTFDYEDDGTVYVMQEYYLVFLKRGETKIEDKEKAAEIQEAHLAYLGDLYEKGYICMNGPFGDDGNIRGATIYRVSSLEVAEQLANGDPAVKAGSLAVEVHPWWLARGTGVK